jgi:hypothetical protein
VEEEEDAFIAFIMVWKRLVSIVVLAMNIDDHVA